MTQLPEGEHQQNRALLPDDALCFSPDGLRIGGMRLARHPVRVVSGDEISTLLALAFNRPLRPDQMARLASATEAARRGDHASANIRLAHAGLTRVPTTFALAERLDAAKQILNHGMFGDDLLNALDLGAPSSELAKNSFNQPRVPAGHAGKAASSGAAVVPRRAARPLQRRDCSRVGRHRGRSRGAQVRWYFAEQGAADFARKLFRRFDALEGIQLYHVEAIVK